MATELNRRTLLRSIALTAAAEIVPPPLRLLSQTPSGQPDGRQRGEMNRISGAFRRQFSVPALSVAITRNGQFVYDEAGGMADKEHAEQVSTASLFRIASVTKPITSVTIFSLIEKGKLNLTDKVFGSSGIFGDKYGKPPYKQYVTGITVDDLLTHTSGGWPNDSTDPMFQHNGWDHDKLITWTIANLPLTYPPGTHWAYSNFGYCLLGRVIEQVTGQPYESYVQANILAPCAITDMRIAGNTLRQRAPNEVVYYGQYNENPYNMNVTRMDSHGGWIASPSSLVQFLDHVPNPNSTGLGNMPSLLKPETIRIMTTPSPVYPSTSGEAYARGWMVRNNGAGNWWHSGSLPGSTTIMVRTATGLCWAALTNTRTQPSGDIDAALDNMMWNIARSVPQWGA